MTRHRIPRDAKSKAVTQMNQSLSLSTSPPLASAVLQPKPAIASSSAQAIAAAAALQLPPTPTPQLPMPSPPTMMDIGGEESDDDFEDFEPPATPGVYLPPPTPRIMRGPPSDNGDYPKTPGPPLRMPEDLDMDPDYSQPPPTPTPMLDSDQSADEHEDIEVEDEEEEAEAEEAEEEEDEEEEEPEGAKKGVKSKGKKATPTKKKVTPKAKTVAKKGGKAKTKTLKTKGKAKAKKGKKKVSPIEIEKIKVEEEEAEVEEADKTPKDGEKEGAKKSPKSPKKKVSKPGVIFTMDQMIQNSIIYMLILNHKKNPVKRSEVVRHCMNGQTKDFPELIEKLTDVLLKIFGIKLYGVEEGLSKTKEKGFVSYLVCSIYPLHISDSVTTRSLDFDAKRSVLFIILSIVFMMNRSVDEDAIWKFMDEMGLSKLVNVKKREDLHRFIKSEYVTPAYLIFEEINETDPPIIRYSWGIRANQEISKYSVLKFVCKIFSYNKLIPEKKPSDFKMQFARALEEEPELVEADREKEEADALAEMEDASDKTPEKDDDLPSTSSGPRKNRPSKDTKIDSLVEDVEAINLNFDDAQSDQDRAQSDRSWSSEGSCHSGPRSNRRLSRSRSRSRTPPSGSSDNELSGARSLRDRKMDIDDEMPGPSSGIGLLPPLKGSSPRGGKAGRGRGRGRGRGYGDGNQSDSDPDQITSFEPIIRTTRSRRGRAKATPVVATGDIDQTEIKQESITPKPPVRKPSPRRGRGRKKRRGKRGGYRGPAAAAPAPVEPIIDDTNEEEHEDGGDGVGDEDDDELLPPPPTPFIQPPTPFVPPPTPSINLNFTDDLESPFERRGPKTRARGRKISEPMTPYNDGPPPTPAPRPESPGAYDAPPPTPGSSLGMDMEIDDDDLEMDISYDTRLELNLQFDPNKPSGSGLKSSNQDMINLDQPPPTPSPIRATRSSKRSTTASRQPVSDEPQFSANDKALEKTLAELVEEFAASGPFPSDDNRDPFGSLSHPRRGK